jgi:predicted RNase H-like HicB family nuclease
MKLTAVFKKVPEGYIAWVEDLPGANTQGATLEEAARTFGKQSGWSLKPTVN